MKSILIVDDEPAVGVAMKRALQRAGYEVAVALSPQLALASLQTAVPDLVITDVIMPQMHGVDLIHLIRSMHPAVRVIAISGGGTFGVNAYKRGALSTQAYLTAALAAGAVAVLNKPFDLDTLFAVVHRVCAE